MIVCLRRIGDAPADWAESAAEVLLELAPRVAVDDDGSVWLDVRGLDGASVAEAARLRLEEAVGCGVAVVPIAAQVAAGLGDGVRVVAPGEEALFLAPLSVSVLGVDERLLALLSGVGVELCGELAALVRESVEVRFGAEALAFWRYARAEDARLLFGPPPAQRERASLDFVDYVVSDPERLAFTVNALLGRLCDDLRARGVHARALVLTLGLANGGEWRRTLRTARPTSSRSAWLRLVRSLLEQLTVPDSVAGVALEVAGTEAAAAVQGDLFDAGFATASSVEAAVARLLETVGGVVFEPEAGAHPLPERRTTLKPVPLAAVAERRIDAGKHRKRGARRVTERDAQAAAIRNAGAATPRDEHAATSRAAHEPAPSSALTLQLLREPRAVEVETVRRRDHEVPVRYHDGAWRRLLESAGPDRLSGGQWDRSYAREYFRAVTEDGVLIWLFRDAVQGRWFVHGWWD